MKKVILGSLVAMMAVSAANAEIASVEYVGGKTGDIAELTTTAKSNLTAAVNELNTGVKAAATKTELSEGLATKQATITDLADIRSGAAAGATALQQAAIVNDEPLADMADKVAPSYARTSFLIDEAYSSIGDLDAELVVLEGTVAANKTAADKGIKEAKDAAANALTDAKAYADGVAATAKSEAIAASDSKGSAAAAETAAKTYADGVAATAKNDAIASASTAADSKIATALEAYTNTTGMNSAIATAKSEAIAAAADAAKIYIDADELTASQNAQNIELKAYADQVESDANTFTTEQINNLGKLATLPTACAEGTSDCALVIRGGDIKWEKVQY